MSQYEFDFECFDFGKAEKEHNHDVKAGDVWILGEHRLMCGDSTKDADISRLTEGKPVDLVLCDPPYGMRKESEGVTGDNLNYDDLIEWNKKWIPLSFKHLKANGSWYCWGIDEPLMDIYSQILRPMKKLPQEQGIKFCNLITWNKGAIFGQRSGDMRFYPRTSEKCLFVQRGFQTYGRRIEDFYEGFEKLRALLSAEKDKTGLSVAEICRLANATSVTHWWSKSEWNFPAKATYLRLQAALRERNLPGFELPFDELRGMFDGESDEYGDVLRKFYESRSYFDNTHDNMNDVWNIGRSVDYGEAEETGGHPTPKPVLLCERCVKSSARPGETVLDLFGGSGSTLIACENTGRRARLMEIAPQWCSVIIDRWENRTGKKADKEESYV